MDCLRFPQILTNPCFPSQGAALRFYLRHRWLAVRLRLEAGTGRVFDWLPLVLIGCGAILF